jgi:hypothetical protein
MSLFWDEFEGDDCFSDFHIDVTVGFGAQRFGVGPVPYIL